MEKGRWGRGDTCCQDRAEVFDGEQGAEESGHWIWPHKSLVAKPRVVQEATETGLRTQLGQSSRRGGRGPRGRGDV